MIGSMAPANACLVVVSNGVEVATVEAELNVVVLLVVSVRERPAVEGVTMCSRPVFVRGVAIGAAVTVVGSVNGVIAVS